MIDLGRLLPVFFKNICTYKKDTINGIINLMSGEEGNLTKIGLGDRTGRMSKQKFEDKRVRNIIFIEKSVTGMYERRYKVDGGENSCSN